MSQRKQSFTFTFTATVTRGVAEVLLDTLISVFRLAGLELSIDFTGGFCVTDKGASNGKV